MLILEEIVKKYDGDLNFDYTEEFFITKINIRELSGFVMKDSSGGRELTLISWR